MAKTSAEHRTILQQKGQWGEFVSYRSGLLLEGMKASEANKVAVEKFLGEEASKTAGEDGGKHNKKGPKEDVGKPKIPANEDPALISSVPKPPPAVSRNAFDGKPPSGEIKNIKWVADNMRVVDVTPRDCPSMRAWNLLCECRENTYFRANFWKDHYGKTIPSKSSLDDAEGADIDGTPTLNLLKKIRKSRDRANELSGVD